MTGRVREREWVLGQECDEDSNICGLPLRCCRYEGEGNDVQPIRSPPNAYPRHPPHASLRSLAYTHPHLHPHPSQLPSVLTRHDVSRRRFLLVLDHASSRSSRRLRRPWRSCTPSIFPLPLLSLSFTTCSLRTEMAQEKEAEAPEKRTTASPGSPYAR